MKKFLGATLISSLVISSSFADDLLAKLTNNVVSDKSFGVEVLDDKQMSEVKGGYIVPDRFFELMNISGYASIAQVAKIIRLSREEQDARALGNYQSETPNTGYYANSRYQEVARIANQENNEFVAITGTMTKTPSYFGIPILKFSYGAAVLHVNDDGSFFKMSNAPSYIYVVSDALRHEKNNLSRFLVQNY